jgi:hypothetical protein
MSDEIDVQTTQQGHLIRVTIEHYRNRGEVIVGVNAVEVGSTGTGFSFVRCRLMAGISLVWHKTPRKAPAQLAKMQKEVASQIRLRSGRAWDAVLAIAEREKLTIADVQRVA